MSSKLAGGTAMNASPISTDLDILDARTWESLRGARIFFTGGTGFFGRWLLESVLHASWKWDLGVHAVVLTRDGVRFRAGNPHLAGGESVSLHQGDVRDFEFPSGSFTHIVHAAAEAGNAEPPWRVKDVIVRGTSRVIDFARRAGVRQLLLTSSGAVYGRQRPEVAQETEDDLGALDSAAPSSYAEGKRDAESLCIAASSWGLEPKIARGFAFVGPYLPLAGSFAIGNFIRDALRGGPIEVQGDGTPYRSYLYAADLAAWLWTILIKGEPKRAYNVGSERGVTVMELARIVAAEICPNAEIRVFGKPKPGYPAERYVPSTARARVELGLREAVGLEEAVRRTAKWASRSPQEPTT